MYAMDRDYWRARSSDPTRWKTILQEATETFAGERVVPFPVPGCRREKFRTCSNSGVGAIALAAHWRAQRIVLVGYDCQIRDGRKHHHPDHPGPLGNCGSIKTWPGQFRKLAAELRVPVINASRETALTCWPRQSLEEALSSSLCQRTVQ